MLGSGAGPLAFPTWPHPTTTLPEISEKRLTLFPCYPRVFISLDQVSMSAATCFHDL